MVAIIGLVLAAALPGYRHITLRSKATAVENDLRQFTATLQTYATQNGRWPADADAGRAPAEVADALSSVFVRTTPIGGLYKWSTGVPADGVGPAKAAIILQTAPGNPVTTDVDLLEMIDRQMDDGDLYTGLMQVGSTYSLVYVIEK